MRPHPRRNRCHLQHLDVLARGLTGAEGESHLLSAFGVRSAHLHVAGEHAKHHRYINDRDVEVRGATAIDVYGVLGLAGHERCVHVDHAAERSHLSRERLRVTIEHLDLGPRTTY